MRNVHFRQLPSELARATRQHIRLTEWVYLIVWKFEVFSVPGDGSPFTQDLHLEHDLNCLPAIPLSREAIKLLGWYDMWHHLLEVVELVYFSSGAGVSVAWTAVHNYGKLAC